MSRCSWLSSLPLTVCIFVFLLGNSAMPLTSAAAQFTRGPFVQNASSNGLQIIWRTATPGSTFVEFGLDANLGTLVTNESLTTDHVVTLADLTANTAYFYRAGSANGADLVMSAVTNFRTLKMQGAIDFVVVGDSWGNTPAAAQIAAVMGAANPEIVLHTGDAVGFGFSEASADLEFFQLYGAQIRTTPFYLLVGNHDLNCCAGVPDPGGLRYQETFYLPTNSVTGTELFYSFDHGDAHFVCLYNPWFLNYVFSNSGPQYLWLTNDLAQTAKPWKLLFSHLPPAHSGAHALKDYNSNAVPDQVEFFNVIVPVAEQYGVQAIFTSHEHNYERFAPLEGLHQIISGGGGRPPYQMLTQHVASAQFWPSYNCLRVQIAGEVLGVETLGRDGVVFDRMTLSKALPERGIFLATSNTPSVESASGNDGDGNINGQRFDFAGAPIFPRAGRFSNLGRAYVNYDASHLYLGFEQVMIYRGNTILLFIETPCLAGVATMAGVGDGVLNSAEGVEGLDCLENLAFTNFAPAIGCVVGDEFGDGQFRDFTRSNLMLNVGQGAFYLSPGLTDVPGVRLQQYNRSPQTNLLSIYTNGVATEQNSDFIELVLPLSALGNLRAGDAIKIGAVVGGDFEASSQRRQIDRSGLGYFLGTNDQGQTLLEGVSVLLGAPLQGSLVALSGERWELSWNAVVGRRYAVDFSDDLETFSPLALPGLPRLATAERESLVLTGQPLARRFYRLRLLTCD